MSEETARTLRWTYQPGEVQIPIMVVAGTENDVIDTADLESLYSHIGSEKVMGLRSNTNHPEMLYSADGYVTAWLMWQLQGDQQASGGFAGDDPEMLSNTNWQDVRIDIQ